MTSNQNKAGAKPTLQSYHDVVRFDKRFVWDSDKEKTNFRKHRVSFEDAEEALNCGLVVVLKETHQKGEERFVYIGRERKFYEAQL